MPSKDNAEAASQECSPGGKALLEKVKITEAAETEPFEKYWEFLKCILVFKNKWQSALM